MKLLAPFQNFFKPKPRPEVVAVQESSARVVEASREFMRQASVLDDLVDEMRKSARRKAKKSKQ